jgi:hypothetical protein
VNFAKFMEVVWLDLKKFCKRYKRNKKTRKGKEEKKIKIENGPGEPFRPRSGGGPRPTRPTPESVQPSLSHSLTSGPQLPVFFHLRPVTTLVTVSLREQ